MNNLRNTLGGLATLALTALGNPEQTLANQVQTPNPNYTISESATSSNKAKDISPRNYSFSTIPTQLGQFDPSYGPETNGDKIANYIILGAFGIIISGMVLGSILGSYRGDEIDNKPKRNQKK